MKKTVLLSVALCAATVISAQSGEITSNRGENWLSESGDWGLTIDANPLLDYAGNLFNGDLDNSFNGFQFPNQMFAIQGKKLVDSETAYRGLVRVGFGATSTTMVVPDIADPTATVEDEQTNSFTAITLGAGLEKRIGSTRIVGVYGGMFTINLASTKTDYEYGNALDATNPINTNVFDPSLNGVTEINRGTTIGVGLNAFGGIEWFAAPKVSISGEYTWGLNFSSTSFDETTGEFFNPVDMAVESTTVEGPSKTSTFGIDTGISGFDIGVNFYFQ